MTKTMKQLSLTSHKCLWCNSVIKKSKVYCSACVTTGSPYMGVCYLPCKTREKNTIREQVKKLNIKRTRLSKLTGMSDQSIKGFLDANRLSMFTAGRLAIELASLNYEKQTTGGNEIGPVHAKRKYRKDGEWL